MIASTTDDPAAVSPFPSTPSTASGRCAAAPPSEQEVLDKYTPQIKCLAAKFSHGDPHLRQDLFQEGAKALVCAARRFDSRRGTKFSTLAYRHMRGRMLNFLRSEQRHHQCISMQDASWQPDTDDHRQDDCLPITPGEIQNLLADFLFQVEVRFLREPLRLFQNNFTPKQRQILNLRYRDGLGPSEIAADLGVSPARISQVLSEAISKFQKAFVYNTISA